LGVTALSVGVSRAQNQQIQFPSASLRLSEAIHAFEDQTGYVVSYAPGLLDVNAPTVLTQVDLPFDEALRQMLDRDRLGYMIHNKFVIVYPETQTQTQTQQSVPVQQAAVVPDPVVPGYSSYLPLRRLAVAGGGLPKIAVKTNLLYGAGTLTPNLSLEFGLGQKTSFALSGGYNPWNLDGTMDDNKKLVHWGARPEFRYWFCERFNGHFLGANPFYTKFNISQHDIPFVNFKKEFRYQGNAYGFGVNYGYQLPLARRWGVEFSAGVGVALMDYDVYDCSKCSGLLENKTQTYFGPTHASISLVFMIR
jgi:hypothetical protein